MLKETFLCDSNLNSDQISWLVEANITDYKNDHILTFLIENILVLKFYFNIDISNIFIIKTIKSIELP